MLLCSQMLGGHRFKAVSDKNLTSPLQIENDPALTMWWYKEDLTIFSFHTVRVNLSTYSAGVEDILFSR